MKHRKNKLTIKICIALVFILIIINMIIKYSRNKSKQDNIYNVMGLEQTSIQFNSKAYFVFDEYSLDAFEGISSNLTEGKLIRNEEKLFDNANAQVNNSIKKQSEFLKNRPKKKFDKNKVDIINSIYNNNLSKLDLSFLDSINDNKYFYEKKSDLIKSYINNDSFIVNTTGFYLSKVDGYESLINSNNIRYFSDDLFNINNIEKDKLQTGLKYVNNKEYHIITKIKNFDKYLSIGIDNLSISFDNQTFYDSNYEFVKGKNDEFYIIFKMNEGIDKAIKHRVSNIVINFKTFKSLKVPKKSIYYINKQAGVYTIDSGRVQFAPVKIIYTENDICSVLTSSEDVLSKSYLDLVRKNNQNLNNDTSDKNYISLYEIKEFSNILLDIGSYKVGDRY